jgi:hypothetical protein
MKISWFTSALQENTWYYLTAGYDHFFIQHDHNPFISAHKGSLHKPGFKKIVRHYATNRKVAGSILDDVTGF